ncbi:hypothetical protein [Parasulfitobacter algicola]|uniref:Lipoprotein n=1 Tax=Parasulfitobacter algicola TaxID=2614809 RepID=A0ABX2IZW1_9RHOB|nr:hypothetical protein [Sulfitobacter algicola]NSX56263.1 hypothetical protein [Sulfitobacter algicola]
MRRSILSVLILGTCLAGCATVRESRVNPFNWFGNAQEETLQAAPERATTQDRRPMVSQIVSIEIDRTPGGAILRAVGLPPTQGYFAGDLVRVQNTDPGVLTYEFRIIPPRGTQRTSTQQSREVVVALFITDQDLQRASAIRVIGQLNAQSLRR